MKTEVSLSNESTLPTYKWNTTSEEEKHICAGETITPAQIDVMNVYLLYPPRGPSNRL